MKFCLFTGCKCSKKVWISQNSGGQPCICPLSLVLTADSRSAGHYIIWLIASCSDAVHKLSFSFFFVWNKEVWRWKAWNDQLSTVAPCQWLDWYAGVGGEHGELIVLSRQFITNMLPRFPARRLAFRRRCCRHPLLWWMSCCSLRLALHQTAQQRQSGLPRCSLCAAVLSCIDTPGKVEI